tara:strand:- start:2681 stop:3901 length:1221 start_codon:yes stop_codon:yes gene_type:complete
MAEIEPTGNNENELLMRCNIYFELLATEPDTENKITKDNAADKLIATMEGTDCYTLIKIRLRDCLLQLGENASIRQNLETNSIQKLLEDNQSVILSLQLDNPITVEECNSANIEECKQKLKGYKDQLAEMVNKARTTTEERKAEIDNLQNENEAIKQLSNILNTIELDKLEENIDLSVENLPEEDATKVGLIRDTLKQIKDGKAKQESSQKEINEQEKLLKEQEKQGMKLQKQATDYRVKTAKAMEEAEKVNDDPEDQAMEQGLQEELKAAEEKAKEGVNVQAKIEAFDNTAQQVKEDGLADTDTVMQEQLGTKNSSDDTSVVEVGSFEDENKALEEAEQNNKDMEALSKADISDEGSDNEVSVLTETKSEKETGKNVTKEKKGGRNKKSRKNRKSSKKKSKKNRR